MLTDHLTAIPKEQTIFRIAIPLDSNAEPGPKTDHASVHEERPEPAQPLLFEIHGDQIKCRAADRSNKNFKMHPPLDL